MHSPAVETGNAGLKKYIWILVAVQAVGGAVLLGLQAAFAVDLGSGGNIGVMIGSIAGAMHYFVLDHKRALSQVERWRFTLYGLLASLIWSVVAAAAIFAIFVGIDDLKIAIPEALAWVKDNLGIMTFVVLFTLGLLFAMLYFMSGAFSRQFAKQAQQQAPAS